MRDHLQRFLHHTRLKAGQWINLNRHVVEFTTLSKRATNRIMAGQNHRSDATREQAPARGDIRSSAGLISMILSRHNSVI